MCDIQFIEEDVPREASGEGALVTGLELSGHLVVVPRARSWCCFHTDSATSDLAMFRVGSLHCQHC